MKDVKIIIDGKEYTAQMSDEQVKEIARPKRARTGYERVKLRDTYYSAKCSDHGIRDTNALGDRENYKKGDYVNDKKLHDDRERARELHDRLEQWQALNDEPVDWGNLKEKNVWYIEYDYTAQNIIACYTLSIRPVGTLGFSTHAKAQEAIDVFRDELMWYFTEYRSRLDEKRTEAAE